MMSRAEVPRAKLGAVESSSSNAPAANASDGPHRIRSWRLDETKRTLAELLGKGALDKEVISSISVSGWCAPVECEIFDYKEMIDDSALGVGKLVLQTISFYNTYGGYILFGVREEASELDFRITGLNAVKEVDCERLKAKLKEFTGERVQVAGAPFAVTGQD